jgi:hypothetical protein
MTRSGPSLGREAVIRVGFLHLLKQLTPTD